MPFILSIEQRSDVLIRRLKNPGVAQAIGGYFRILISLSCLKICSIEGLLTSSFEIVDKADLKQSDVSSELLYIGYQSQC